MKGMSEAAAGHGTLFRNFLDRIRSLNPEEDILPLDAGCCSYCDACAYLDGAPCPYPDQALSSLEAYGMNVAALMKKAGMPYNHGKKAVGFVGLILFNPEQ
jgi:predicted metal-binding protein